MESFGALIGIMLAAVLVEAVINVIKNAKELYKDWRYWIALVVGVAVAIAYDIDLFRSVGLETEIQFVGAALTGVIVSRGANYVSDILKKINGD